MISLNYLFLAPAISDGTPVISDGTPVISDQAPVISDEAPVIRLTSQDSVKWESLMLKSKRVREKQRAQRQEMEQVITCLCEEHYLSTNSLGQLLGRDEDTLRRQYLKPMVDDERLILAYPDSPNHPQQGYKTFKK